ncbi:hypothetical protein H2199_006781 [Coniosporium tulheliwenetii]|uniref:Uncharacterized protein n=1 Tax=Coniosporium tulheliwenetii TaxID=3383036 RepID=A0ACC2YUI0_9PEZI|nr:hypothetical protein H2199_006781 [Cladosporium sp. JES 115]
MAAPSPSEFLTFFRRAAMHPALRRGLVSRPPRAMPALSSRPFSSSIIRADKDNLSTDSSVKTDSFLTTTTRPTRRTTWTAHSKGEGGTATSQADERNNTERAKKEHPEAPDVVIGMQDERGAKGH